MIFAMSSGLRDGRIKKEMPVELETAAIHEVKRLQ